MTTLQLKVAIAIDELGSISSASNKLDISQPNASSCLKSLEHEIGFQIFNRTKSGATLTEKGQIFLEHAKHIIAEHDSIMDIQKVENKYRLRVGSTNYSLASEPFLYLCSKHRDDFESDLKYSNVSIEEGIEALENYTLDIIVAPTLKSQIAGIKNICQKNGITLISLCEIQAAINMRKGHPAALDGRCKNIKQGSDVMKDYPYVSYHNLSKDSSSTGYNDSDFVQCKYKIYVDGNDVRLRIVSTTNAFSFAIQPTKATMENYNLASFPVPGINLEVFCLIHEIDKNKPEIQEYISLLQQEINKNYF